jgi:hypothetical protein
MRRPNSHQTHGTYSDSSGNQHDRSRRIRLWRISPKSCRFPSRNSASGLLPQRYSHPRHWKIWVGKGESFRNTSTASLRPQRKHQRPWYHLFRRVEHQLWCKRGTKLHTARRHQLLHCAKHRQLTDLGERKVWRTATAQQVWSHGHLDRTAYSHFRWVGVQSCHQWSGRFERYERHRQKEMMIPYFEI